MKTMSTALRAGTLALALLAAACAGPQLYHGQLSNLDKGLPQAEVSSRLKQPPLSSHVASVGARSFQFDRYRLNNGVQVDTYLLAYEGGRLTFWGYVSEFRRLPDAGLNTALNAVMPEITAASR
jgi:hypothetical protein